jgi:hypothetical protein
MVTFSRFFVLSLAIYLLPGCAKYSEKVVVGGPDAEEAAIRLEESRREYYDCVENAGPGKPTCDSLKALYEQDRKAYESTAR